ncbi:MAG: haloacid dehalogenase type II [Acidimicrobiia bacterium]|nr:haloacid dehalogenase type II [Acidimicrobiia bacterium]
MREVIVFDVNETLLDVRALAPVFRSSVGSDALVAPWFARMLRNSLISTVTDRYRRFDEIGVDALVAVAREAGIDIDIANARAVVDGMRSLPAHPDVPAALERLTDSGLELATLTNSAPDVISDQLRNAGIAHCFEQSISVDGIGVFKPHPATYRHAAQRLGTSIDGLRLVAAHDWDVVGALRAGAHAAYVARNAPLTVEAADMPDIVASDLGAIADQILALRTAG